MKGVMVARDLRTVPYDPEFRPGATSAVFTCLRVGAGEKVVLITDEEALAIGASLFEQFERAGAKVEAFVLEDFEGLQRQLRRYKYRELLRLMVRDSALRVPVAALGREQAALADALISAALAWAERQLTARYGLPEVAGFCVLGLGKLGGEDLNFSSDVDLVYLYRADGHTTGGSAGALPTVQYYTRLGEAVTQALTKVTAEGFCYRVDLNLRPQGRAGAMVISKRSPQAAS